MFTDLKKYLPTQDGLRTQISVCIGCPTQSKPPYSGRGFEHVRLLDRVPFSHVTEHFVHAVHIAQEPSTIEIEKKEHIHSVFFSTHLTQMHTCKKKNKWVKFCKPDIAEKTFGN